MNEEIEDIVEERNEYMQQEDSEKANKVEIMLEQSVEEEKKKAEEKMENDKEEHKEIKDA